MGGNPNGLLKTKICCTIGPASADDETLAALCRSGMNVARLNMSHSSPDEVRDLASRLRAISGAQGMPVAVLVDLQGPKIRLGELGTQRVLESGQRVDLAPSEAVESDELPITYARLADDLQVGDRILMNDGRVELRATEIRPPRVEAEVVIGGELASGKGVNLPGVRLSSPALTPKDRADIDVAREIDADYVALSFVRSSDDVRELRELAPEPILVLTKIEKALALEDLEGILEASDAVMVARGDLGSELPFERVPLVQKDIVRRANAAYRPVVIATEMLESMIERPRPTRAEVSDVANAILDGTDGVLLSAETAVGRHPLQAVQALTRVIGEVEASGATLPGSPPYDVSERPQGRGPVPTEVAVARATLEAVRAIGAPAVVTFTHSGYTARVVSSRRPPVPILAVTHDERVCRQLALVWGVVPVLCSLEPTHDNMWEVAQSELRRRRIADDGDRVALTAGVPFHVRGTTNMVRIETL